MLSEEETFRHLKRSSFEEVENDLNQWVFSRVDSRTLEEIIKQHLWTKSEYDAEVIRRGY